MHREKQIEEIMQGKAPTPPDDWDDREPRSGTPVMDNDAVKDNTSSTTSIGSAAS